MAYGYRTDPSVPAFLDDRPIIVFDGICVFCSIFARFVLRADRRRRFRLMAAQCPLGVALYRYYGLDPVNYQTNILLEGGRARLKSDASIRIFEILGFPWCLASVARLIPYGPRDRLYEYVAKNRLRWFGVRDTCFLPEPNQIDRFLG
jgi:predicted DCC family thiol-disulfide oxidoreductase YuxK